MEKSKSKFLLASMKLLTNFEPITALVGWGEGRGVDGLDTGLNTFVFKWIGSRDEYFFKGPTN
jgi:hypothetical protein